MLLLRNTLVYPRRQVQGILWMIVLCFISNLNDILTKYLGGSLPGAEVAFFRFFFSIITLVPFMLIRGRVAFLTYYPKVHIIRTLLLFFATTLWCYGTVFLPLTLATTISFTIPLFVLPMARIFLKEYIDWRLWCATILGFIGVIVSSYHKETNLNQWTLFLLVSTILFASLDIINKGLLIKNENLLPMLFYSALGTSILGFIPAFLTWQFPSSYQLFFLLLLGGGANLISYCLLKACTITDVSVIQPFRYIELILSIIFGIVIFQETLSINILIGAVIIIITTLYISYYELLRSKVRKDAVRSKNNGK